MIKNLLSMLLMALSIVTSSYGTDYYVATSGNDSNPGTQASPFRTLTKAISTIQPGDIIYLRGGTYNESATILIERANSGTSSAKKQVFAYSGEVPVLNFSTMAESASNRGIVLDGNYWHFKGLIIEQAGDNGILLSGNNNTVESCILRKNKDSGLQISRYSTSYTSISEWPANNLILNCEAYDNKDATNENADGFAAKLTVGTGNIFRNCVAHHNIDDGWDLYTKTETGPIGAILLENCIAHSNGTLTTGGTSGSGDKNGFKLGGEDISVNHTVRRCIAFNNGKHGFTYNRNLGTIEMTNNTAYNNAQRNFTFDGGTSKFTNNLSYRSSTGTNDKIVGTIAGTTNGFWIDNATTNYTVNSADFVSLTPGANATPTSNGFLNLASGSDLIDKGAVVSGLTYSGSAPDIGAIESGTSTATYTLTVTTTPTAGGSVTKSPDATSYNSGTIVSLTAVPASGYTFSGWSGAVSGTSTTVSVTMDANKSVTATFTSTLYTLNVSSNPSAGGSVTKSPNATSYASGTVVNLTAAPANGYVFSGWSGDASGTSTTVSVTMNANKSVVANFTTSTGGSTTLRIEDASSFTTGYCSADGSRQNSYTGADNGYYVNLSNSAAKGINWKVSVPSAGSYSLKWRYANAGSTSATSAKVLVNGTTATSSVAFPKTSSWSTWTTTTASVNLAAGVNSIRLETTSSSEFANIDWIEVTGNSPTAASCNSGARTEEVSAIANCSLVEYQLENGTFSSGSVTETVNGGFTGSSYVNTANSTGSWFQIVVTPPTAGTHDLKLRFANGTTTDRPVSVSVNGTTVISSLSFPATGAWTTWVLKDFSLALNAGSNTIRFTALTSAGAANADRLDVCQGSNYTLTTSVSGQGTVSPDGGSFASGTSVNLTATPASGWTFVGWGGDATGVSATTSVVMDANKSVIANFQSTTTTPDFSIVGFATLNGGTTGGQGGTTRTISSLAQLQAWALEREDNSTPEIVYIDGKISSSSTTVVTIKRGGNVSILGVGTSGELQNVGLNFRQYNNVILRNLKIHEVFYPNDALTIDECQNVWVDHNEFFSKIGAGIGVDTYDGLLDIKKGSKQVTVSWNHLHHHMKTVLIGHTDNSSQQAQDSQIRVTFHHNYFESTSGRNPSLRFGAVHMFNNYFKNIDDYGIAVRQGAHALIENNVYENVLLPITTNKFDGPAGFACERGNIFTSCGANSITQTGCDWWTSSTLPYAYTLDPVSSVTSNVPPNVGVGKINISSSARTSSPETGGLDEYLKVYQNYPNPVETSTTIKIWLKERMKVKIGLYNSVGTRIGTIVDNMMEAGDSEFTTSKKGLSPGLYIYKVQTKVGSVTKQMIIQ